MTNTVRRVEFTRQQLEYLEQEFPEKVGTADTTPEQRAWSAAQRSVLLHVRGRITKQPGE